MPHGGPFPCGLDSNRAFKNFDGGAADARYQFFAALRDFHFDVAGAAHFFALQNGQRVAGCELAMAHQIRAERAGGGARGGVFVNFPRKHAARENFAVAAECEAVGHRRVFAEQLAQLKHVHGDFAERGAIPERHHEIEDAGGDALGIEMRIEDLSESGRAL